MDEYSLIRLAQKGDRDAFQSLIALYYPYVSRFLTKLCGNEVLSEDLTQETFLKLIRGIDGFVLNGKASFSTWVMAIAKNCYLDSLRRTKRVIISLEEQEAIADLNVQDIVLDRLQAEEILNALEQLPPEQAIPIKLKYMEQQTLEEIAQQFSCEPKTVKSRIHNGMVRLRKMLKGDFRHG